MPNLKIDLPVGATISDGKQITFKAPCDCSEVTALLIDGVVYALVDASGNVVAGGNSFVANAMISVIVDTDENKAFLQNAANATFPIATQAEAESGMNNNKVMTPLRVKQSVEKNTPAPNVMTGASTSSAGKAGLVPAPSAGDNEKFLCGDGSFKEAGKVQSVNGMTGDVVVDVNVFNSSGHLAFPDGSEFWIG